MNRALVLEAARLAVGAIDGTPTVRSVVAMFKRMTGQGIRSNDVMLFLRETNGRHRPETTFVPEMASLGDTGETIGKPSHDARADHSGISIPVTVTSKIDPPPPPPPALLEPPSKPVPKPRPNSIAAQDPETDFGIFEPEVAAMVALERRLHPRKASSGETIVRQRLALLWRKHGDSAFVYGLETSLQKGAGLDYGCVVMERHRNSPKTGRDAEQEWIDNLPLAYEIPPDPGWGPNYVFDPLPWDRLPASAQ